MKTNPRAAIPAIAAILAMLSCAAHAAEPSRPQANANQAILALSNGLPVFTTQISGGSGFEDGKRLATTNVDFITYEMEHGSFDIAALRDFMLGLSEATAPRGTRIPVLVTLPVLGTDSQTLLANVWMIRQVLAAGVSGILLCQAESPEAVRVFVEATRYPFAVGADPNIEHRGFRSEDMAMRIWRMSREDYLEKADPWPLNPYGELLLGIKIESPKAAALSEELLAVPGIALVEWAPGDQSFFMLPKPYRLSRKEIMQDPRMVESRDRVSAVAARRKIAAMALCTVETVVSQLRSGISVCYVNDALTVERGRAFAAQADSVSSTAKAKP